MFVWLSLLFEVLPAPSGASPHLPTGTPRVLPADLQGLVLSQQYVYAAASLSVCFSFYFFSGWIFCVDHPYLCDLSFQMLFYFRVCYFYACFSCKSSFPLASAGVNGTFIYYYRQPHFLGGQLSCVVAQTKKKNPLATLATLFHICGLGRGEKQRQWPPLSRKVSPLSVWSQKMLRLPHLIHWFF